MIFLTLGTQLPFDRLVEALDLLAPELEEDVFGQIGEGAYNPRHFPCAKFLDPASFADRVASARVIVGHAGIGTILTGMRARKPLILMARRASLKEHRNDHQSATAAQVRKIPGVIIVETVDDMRDALTKSDLPAMSDTGTSARARLIGSLRQEIGLG